MAVFYVPVGHFWQEGQPRAMIHKGMQQVAASEASHSAVSLCQEWLNNLSHHTWSRMTGFQKKQLNHAESYWATTFPVGHLGYTEALEIVNSFSWHPHRSLVTHRQSQGMICLFTLVFWCSLLEQNFLYSQRFSWAGPDGCCGFSGLFGHVLKVFFLTFHQSLWPASSEDRS